MSSYTTTLWASGAVSGYFLANKIFHSPDAVTYTASNIIWRWDGAVWTPRYSTPTVSCANVAGSNSGNANSGSVTSASAAPSTGGRNSGSFSWSWTYVSGNNTMSVSNATSRNPTWTATVSNGGTGPQGSGTINSVWNISVTDTITGATTSTNITISLTWTNAESPIAVSGQDGSGSANITIGPGTQTVSTGENGPNGTCFPSGGSGSGYTFFWDFVTGDSGISINNTGIQTPTWSKSLTVTGGGTTTATAQWEVTIGDSQGNPTAAVRITVTLTLTSQETTLAVTGINGSGSFTQQYGPVTTSVSTGEGGGQNSGCSPTGGSGVYNYSWTYVSGDTSIAPNSASIQNPTFSRTFGVSGGSSVTLSGVWQVSVTDNQGHGPVTATISISLTLTSTYPTIMVSGINGSGSVDLGTGSGTVTVSTGESGPNGGCSVTGGNGSYVFSWSYFSGDSGIGISSTTAQDPTWSKSLTVPGGGSTSTSATWQVSVTDTAGNGPSTATAGISLSLTSEEPSLTITGQDALGSVEIGFHQGEYSTTVSTGTGGSQAPFGSQVGGAFPAGGSGSYNYSWAYISGDTRATLNSASIQSPTWSAFLHTNASSPPDTSESIWQCAVTDSQGHGPVTVEINVKVGLVVDND